MHDIPRECVYELKTSSIAAERWKEKEEAQHLLADTSIERLGYSSIYPSGPLVNYRPRLVSRREGKEREGQEGREDRRNVLEIA